MLYLVQTAAALGFALSGNAMPSQAVRTSSPNMLYGEPRPVQIIPSVLPADWANST